MRKEEEEEKEKVKNSVGARGADQTHTHTLHLLLPLPLLSRRHHTHSPLARHLSPSLLLVQASKNLSVLAASLVVVVVAFMMEAAAVVALVLLMSSSLVASDWCVCKSDQPQAALQKTIDYACGAGADCNSIHEQGQCFNPNTVVAHCSWAANSYFQRNRAMGATCDFTGTATLTTSDPSVSGCSFPASASAAGTSTTPTMGGTTGTMTPGTFTPGTGMGTTTGTGMGTGTTTGTGLGGLGPTGTSSMDTAAAGLHLRAGLTNFCAVLLSLIAFA